VHEHCVFCLRDIIGEHIALRCLGENDGKRFHINCYLKWLRLKRKENI